MDIRSERTRQMLVDAFEKLQESKAMEEITVSEICEVSTVRRATFYRHFVDKYDFYEYYLQTLTDRFLAEASDELGSSTAEGLQPYVEHMHRQLIDFIESHPAMTKHAMGRTTLAGTLDMMMKQMAEGIAIHIDQQAKQNGWKLEVTSEFLSVLYSGAMVHSLRWWLFENKPIPKEDLIKHTTTMFMNYFPEATKN